MLEKRRPEAMKQPSRAGEVHGAVVFREATPGTSRFLDVKVARLKGKSQTESAL